MKGTDKENILKDCANSHNSLIELQKQLLQETSSYVGPDEGFLDLRNWIHVYILCGIRIWGPTYSNIASRLEKLRKQPVKKIAIFYLFFNLLRVLSALKTCLSNSGRSTGDDGDFAVEPAHVRWRPRSRSASASSRPYAGRGPSNV